MYTPDSEDEQLSGEEISMKQIITGRSGITGDQLDGNRRLSMSRTSGYEQFDEQEGQRERKLHISQGP